LKRTVLGLVERVRASSERGEVYVEYVVLAALATLVILGGVEALFNAVSTLFQRIGATLSGL
jgi:Flp pilus assembly pilin Flp